MPLIGMIHLRPLPGSYRYRGEGMTAILDAALRDLDSLEVGGADAAIVENFGDAPFAKFAPRETIAMMTVIVQEIIRTARIPVGVNVLRNDGMAALAIAAAVGAAFIRVNVFSGVAFTDQGVIEGNARTLLELRNRLHCEVKILADVHVKHAVHLTTIEEAAIDITRNYPDGLIISGIGTGKPVLPEDLQRVKQVTSLPVFIGSGVRTDNLSTYGEADGFIVGTALKEGETIDAPIIPKLVYALAESIARLRAT
ncbi:BtpA/SgcQ family protein [Candidatus Acetothermia bacterium]|nr:BtpA/SgcQ family protein [Candidatus Acetothermia bacterium]